jgi:ribosomal protein S18 acetylase RimI-like enzyme
MRTVPADEAPAVGALLAEAFFDDPFVRWWCPDPASRGEEATALFTANARLGLALGDGLMSDDGSAVAIYLPPGTVIDDATVGASGLPDVIGGSGPERAGQIGRFLDTLGGLHAAATPEPHWQLLFLGVAPAAQGRGIGRRLMEAMLERADGAVGARLTTGNPVALALYASLGFEVKEPLAILSGRFRSSPPAGTSTRPMREEDLAAAAALCERVHGVARVGDLREALRAKAEPTVLERDGGIVAYASHRRVCDLAHGVAEDEADLRALLLGLAPPRGAKVETFLPTRQASLLRWCLEEGLRIEMGLSLVVKGEYREPKGAWFPSSWY